VWRQTLYISNQKDAKVAFGVINQPNHKEAVQIGVVLPREYEDCGELFSSQHATIFITTQIICPCA